MQTCYSLPISRQMYNEASNHRSAQALFNLGFMHQVGSCGSWGRVVIAVIAVAILVWAAGGPISCRDIQHSCPQLLNSELPS